MELTMRWEAGGTEDPKPAGNCGEFRLGGGLVKLPVRQKRGHLPSLAPKHP